MNGHQPAPGSLVGIRVVEIGTSVAAPFATQVLGDLGAEVIKVERPGAGDDSRHWAPPTWNGESVTFLALNRNKRSVALDLRSEPGRVALEKLLAGADVFIQNLRPGAIAKLGFTPDRLSELNPQLIYVEMTGYGPQGPLAARGAYDPLLQAYSGLVSITGEEGRDPVRIPVSILDMGTGMWAALAVLEALRRRETSAAGSHVEVSLLQTALMWLNMPLLGVLSGAEQPARMGSGLAGVVPYGAYPSSDGHVFLSAGNDDAWGRLRTAIDAEGRLADPRFATNPGRVQLRSEVDRAVGECTCSYTASEVLKRLDQAGVPCAPVQTLDQVTSDDQVNATGILRPLPHPTVPDLTVVDLPMTFDGSYPPHKSAPPVLGDSTRAVLGELGFSAAEIDALVAAGKATEPTFDGSKDVVGND